MELLTQTFTKVNKIKHDFFIFEIKIKDKEFIEILMRIDIID